MQSIFLLVFICLVHFKSVFSPSMFHHIICPLLFHTLHFDIHQCAWSKLILLIHFYLKLWWIQVHNEQVFFYENINSAEKLNIVQMNSITRWSYCRLKKEDQKVPPRHHTDLITFCSVSFVIYFTGRCNKKYNER